MWVVLPGDLQSRDGRLGCSILRPSWGLVPSGLVEQRWGPGEGDYLTYKRNRAFDSDGVYPDENYAREIQQLRLGLQRAFQKGVSKRK